MPYIAVDELDVWLRDVGSGVPVVLLHGGPVDHRVFAQQVDGLASRFRCIIPDLPGWGRSSGEAGNEVDTRRLAESVAALLDRLGSTDASVGSAHIVGLSMGGFVAVELAGMRPELARSVAVVGTSLMPSVAVRDRSFEQEAERLLQEGRQVLAARLAQRMLSESATVAAAASLCTMVESTPYETLLALYRWIARDPGDVGMLDPVRCPVLTCAGEMDGAVPLEVLQSMASRARDGRAVTVSGAGHLVPLEQPARLNDVLVGFWDAIGPGRGA